MLKRRSLSLSLSSVYLLVICVTRRHHHGNWLSNFSYSRKTLFYCFIALLFSSVIQHRTSYLVEEGCGPLDGARHKLICRRYFHFPLQMRITNLPESRSNFTNHFHALRWLPTVVVIDLAFERNWSHDELCVFHSNNLTGELNFVRVIMS